MIHKKDTIKPLIDIHRQGCKLLSTKDYDGFVKLAKSQLKEKIEVLRINKLKIILIVSKNIENEKILCIRKQFIQEYNKLIKTLEAK